MLKPSLEKNEIQKECVVDKDFDWLEKDKSLSIIEKAQYAKELIKDVFNDISDYSRQAYKSGMFGRMLADKADGVRFFLHPGLFQNLQGNHRRVTEFYGEDNYGTGYYSTPERKFILVRQANMFEVEWAKKPFFMVHVTECSVIIARNDDNICVSHIGMSYRREVEGVLDFLKKEGYQDEDIYVVASVGPYQEEMAQKINNTRLSRVEEYEDLGIKPENIVRFEHEMERDGEDNIHRNTTEVIVTDEYIYKYSFDHRSIGGWFGMRNRNESRLIETESGMEELDVWDEEIIEW